MLLAINNLQLVMIFTLTDLVHFELISKETNSNIIMPTITYDLFCYGQ